MEKIYLEKEKIEQLPIIDVGFESIVYDYDNKKAIKLFTKYNTDEQIFILKQKKIELINTKNIKDLIKSFCLIYNNKNEFIAYSMEKLKNFKSLDKMPLNINQILNLFIDLYNKLNNIHNNEIIIYDLKMKNIMIDKNLNFKFCDIDSMGINNYNPEHINSNRNLIFDGLVRLNNERNYKKLDLLLLFYTFVNCCINQYYLEDTFVQQKFIDFNQLNMLTISDEFKNIIYDFLSGKQEVKSSEQFIKILINEKQKRP